MASSSVIGSLRVNLGLDSAQFARGARGVSAPLTRMRQQFMAVAGVATIMGGAIAAAALAGARQIDEAAKSARRLDASIGAFRALELAAGEAGVSLSGLTNDIQTMNRELSTIGTSGNGQRALDALGLSIGDLEGLDADEKLAVIADQVKALGLSAGETTAVLRDLGVRNREMALLVLGGGDAIRAARTDVQEYGLAISAVDASRIEVANDQLGRLGLITQYAGQQLAIALVPAMGALAAAMTDSLREGGLLRAMIDGLANNIDTIIASMGVAVAVFGVRYVAALALARGATGLFSGSLIVLRGALLATGIGALVVGAGFLIAKFQNLVVAAGGFGNALGLLRDLASEIVERIGMRFRALQNDISASWALIKANGYDTFQGIMDRSYAMGDTLVGVAVGAKDAFIAAFGALPDALGSLMFAATNSVIGGVESMINGVIRMVNSFTGMINNTLNSLPDWAKPDGGFNMGQMGDVSFGRAENPFKDAAGISAAASDAFADAIAQSYVGAASQAAGEIADNLRGQSQAYDAIATGWTDMAGRPVEAMEAIRAAMAAANEEIVAGVDASTDLSESLSELAGEGSGGGAIGAVAEAAQTAAEQMQELWENSGFKSFIDDLSQGLSQVKSFGDAWDVVKNTALRALQGIAEKLINSGLSSIGQGIFNSVSGGGGGGLLGSLFAGFFDKGGNIPAGQFGIAGENGAEIIRGPAQVTSTRDTAKMMGGGGVVYHIDARGATEGTADLIARKIREATPGIQQGATQQTIGYMAQTTEGWG